LNQGFGALPAAWTLIDVRAAVSLLGTTRNEFTINGLLVNVVGPMSNGADISFDGGGTWLTIRPADGPTYLPIFGGNPLFHIRESGGAGGQYWITVFERI